MWFDRGRLQYYSKWGYQDNSKPIHFFYEKILSVQKCKSTKTNQPTKIKTGEQKTTMATVSCTYKNF